MTDESKVKAGKARWKGVPPEARKVLVSKAAHARWKDRSDEIRLADYTGTIDLGGVELSCAVLDDGTRVLSERSVSDALEHRRHPDDYDRKLAAAAEGADVFPAFVPEEVAQYLGPSTRESLVKPMRYRVRKGWGIPAIGIPALVLADICDAYTAAREDGVLSPEHIPRAKAASKLTRALARVALVALIDEATGYQVVRDRDELQRLLGAYVAEEHRPWMAMFPNDFYVQLFRLRNVKTDDIRKRPPYFGNLTNNIVYRRLLPGMLPRLDELNPTNEKGRRARTHHQHLKEQGEAHLRSHLAGVVYLMKSSSGWKEFMAALDRAAPLQLALTP